MASKVINKVMDFLGMAEEEEDEVKEMDNEDESVDVESLMSANKKQSKVVNIHTSTSTKVVIIKPDDFDEATVISDNLKARKIIVINTTALEPKTGQRLLDFVGGVCYALGGDLQQVEKGVYLISPSNIEVNNELKTELSSKGIFNWNK
ncbi:cell division protein SepF [Clostridium estertheticum]|uniref:cell division protein SepF n=1 Tax=Clostridium estertheticum TaxID=238834 RepID=UPI001C0D3AF6|nr:cell division protein SepF [Clostridium estertheticum]MBU3214219.1 cell division protein SepF [Clostridium estertheticum]WAG54764.1 cell division protein SepF [Clostridium estertheticum]